MPENSHNLQPEKDVPWNVVGLELLIEEFWIYLAGIQNLGFAY